MGLNIINIVTICCLVGSFCNIVKGYPAELNNEIQLLEQPENLEERSGLLGMLASPIQKVKPMNEATGDVLSFENISKTGLELLKQFAGALPYLKKALLPLFKIMFDILRKARTVLLNYLQSLPPETLGNINKMFLALIPKLANLGVIQTFLKMGTQLLM